MILVDTSVWVDHLRTPNAQLAERLDRHQVLAHPWVIGELALGNLHDRAGVISALRGLPTPTVATGPELLSLIDRESLHGSGIGYVDAQLLASTRLTPDARLWTADRRLASVATRLGVSFASGQSP